MRPSAIVSPARSPGARTRQGSCPEIFSTSEIGSAYHAQKTSKTFSTSESIELSGDGLTRRSRARRRTRADARRARRGGAGAGPRRPRSRRPGAGQRRGGLRAQHRARVAGAPPDSARGDRRVLVRDRGRSGLVLRAPAGDRRRAGDDRLTRQRDAEGGRRRHPRADRAAGGAAERRRAPDRADGRLGRPGRPVGDGRHRQGA